MKKQAKVNPAKIGTQAQLKGNWLKKDDPQVIKMVEAGNGAPVVVKHQLYTKPNDPTIRFAQQIAQSVDSLLTGGGSSGQFARLSSYVNNNIVFAYDHGTDTGRFHDEGAVLRDWANPQTGEITTNFLCQVWGNKPFYSNDKPFLPTDSEGKPVDRVARGFYSRIAIGVQGQHSLGYFVADGTYHPVNSQEEMLEWFAKYQQAPVGVSTRGAGAVPVSNVLQTEDDLLPY